MVEQHIQTNITDSLVPGLDFRGGVPSAEYVKSSKLVRWRAEAGDRFSQAARQLRFRLVDDCWLQSGTVRLQVTLNNLAAGGQNGTDNPLQPRTDPLGMFSSARLYMGGQLVEDIQELGVVSVMLDYFKPLNRRLNDSMQNHPLAANDDTREPLRAGRGRKLIFELPFGMLRQRLWLPLHLTSQLVIELTLGPAAQSLSGTANTSSQFDLSDVSLLGTCMHVDSAISAGYHQHLDAGLPLPIPFQSLVVTKHVVTQPNFTLSLSRSLSRLKQIFFCLIRSNSAKVYEFTGKADVNNLDDESDNMSFQVQIGSSKFPDGSPAEGVAEHHMRAMQALGKQLDHDDVALTPAVYLANKTIYAVDTERCGNEAAFQGISTRDGKVMTLTVNNAYALDGTAANNIYNVIVVQVYDGIVNLRKGAIDVSE